MKRIIIGMIACICAITVMAQVQTHDVKGVVFDRRQQPIVGALVTAKGTNISTITDVDGKFLLQDTPVRMISLIPLDATLRAALITSWMAALRLRPRAKGIVQ